MPRCPTCGHVLSTSSAALTKRELDVLVSWWMVGWVKEAARREGISEQRAKNLLARARIRSGVSTNQELLEHHFAAVRSAAADRMQHNPSGTEAA